MNKSKINKLTKIGMLSAVAFLLQVLGSVMGLKVGGFLEIELSDLPALIGTFALGPLSGVIIELVKNLLHCTMTSTAFVGEFANFVVNGVFVLTAGLIYKRNRTRSGALIGMGVSVIAMMLAAILANLYIMLPLYMPTADLATRISIVAYTITPFNFFKGIAISLITFFLYKPLSPIIKAK